LPWKKIILKHRKNRIIFTPLDIKPPPYLPIFRRRFVLVRDHAESGHHLRCCLCDRLNSCCRVFAPVAKVPPRNGEVVRVKGDDAAAGVVATPAVDAHAFASQAGRAGRQGLGSPPLARQPHADVAVVRRLGSLEAEQPAHLGCVYPRAATSRCPLGGP